MKIENCASYLGMLEVSIAKTITLESAHILTLQETKWDDYNDQIVKEAISSKYKGFIHLNAISTAEGLLLVEGNCISTGLPHCRVIHNLIRSHK
jgi:stalled ribosome rescue protein Dom34